METKRNYLSLLLLGHLFICLGFSSAQNPDTLWKLKLPGSGWQQDELLYLISMQDNNYVTAGVVLTGESTIDIWVVKYTASGDILRNKTFQVDEAEPWAENSPRGLEELSTGELVIFALNSQYKHCLIFLDSEGNISRLLNYVAPEDPYYVYAGAVIDNETILVAGEHFVWENNAWLGYSWYRKIDVSGTMIWEHSFPLVRWQDTFLRIGKMPDGGFILAATKSYLSSDKGILLKMDSAGNLQWMQTYNESDHDMIQSVKPTLDGGYIVAGEHKISSDPARINFWVMKTDQQGNKIQSFEFADESDFYLNRGRSVLQCDDGSYIAVDQTVDAGLIIKFSPCCDTLGIEEPVNLSGFSISQNYPNPFNNSTTISWYLPERDYVVFKVHDFKEREVKNPGRL